MGSTESSLFNDVPYRLLSEEEAAKEACPEDTRKYYEHVRAASLASSLANCPPHKNEVRRQAIATCMAHSAAACTVAQTEATTSVALQQPALDSHPVEYLSTTTMNSKQRRRFRRRGLRRKSGTDAHFARSSSNRTSDSEREKR